MADTKIHLPSEPPRAGCDVLVLGAGSAGCVIAARLTEQKNVSVCLVEAGGMPTDPAIADPLQWPFLQGGADDWNFHTLPQVGTAGRSHAWPRGRVLGGSSCLNAMAHVRGHPEDFTAWADAAGERWGYASLLKAFMRSECFSQGASAVHGGDGPLAVLLPDRDVSPVVRAYMQAGLSLGAPALGDHNAGPIAGVAVNQLTIRNGRRMSVADAYLLPILDRPNLHVITGAEIERLEFSGDRAIGAWMRQEQAATFLAADTVVLCAGAIASPLVLMRSGIGDPAELARVGVPCRLPLRETGRNLHDHLLAAGNVYAAQRLVPESRLQHSESLMYLHSDDIARADGAPDCVLACVVLPVVTESFARPETGAAYTIMSGVTHPTSRGSIRLSGLDAADPPLIDPNYLATEHDRRTFAASLGLARSVGHADALSGWRREEILPGADVRSADAVQDFLQRAATTHNHPVGTCRMDRDPDVGVVDGDLRVHGVRNLFVVDASVIPRITTGPVNAAVIAIAETWAGDVWGRLKQGA